MQASSSAAQGRASIGQAFAAIAIILALAIIVPMLGVLMIPGVLIAAWMRAHLPDLGPARRRAFARTN